MTVALHRHEAVIATGTEVIARMRDLCSSLQYAALLTDDGFQVVATAHHSIDDGRFAGMASSMQALGDAVARELSIGSGEYVVIASPAGHVVQRRVPRHPLVVSALFGDDETLGKALAITRQSAEQLAGFLDSHHLESSEPDRTTE